MTYSEILERLEAATGPDREIDCMIGYAVDLTADNHVFRQYADNRKQDWATIAEICAPDLELFWSGYLPTYTASLDAVTALIESRLPGWWWQVGFAHPDWSDDGNSGVWGRVFTDTHGHWDEDIERGKTPTLALLTAAIRALADKEAING